MTTPERQKPLPSTPSTGNGLSPSSRRVRELNQQQAFSHPSPQDPQRDGSTSEAMAESTSNVEGARYDISRQGSIKKLITGLTGPSGGSGLPPSRPSSIASAVSSKLDGRSPIASRKGFLPFSGGGDGGGNASGAGILRPPSSASKTHVPSLAAQGFFRPMSSRRLQAQRSQRPNSLLGTNSLRPETRDRDIGETSSYRQSVGSDAAVRGTPLQPAFMRGSDGLPPPSRGSNLTEYELQDRATLTASPTGVEALPSHGDNLLSYPKPSQPMDFDTALKNVNHLPLPVQRISSKTFQSSFIIPGNGAAVAGGQPQHDLRASPSGNGTSITDREKPFKEAVRRPRKNYQYFTGNTVFCWGGRLQNARDRPISIASAIGFLLPSILFLIFS